MGTVFLIIAAGVVLALALSAASISESVRTKGRLDNIEREVDFNERCSQSRDESLSKSLRALERSERENSPYEIRVTFKEKNDVRRFSSIVRHRYINKSSFSNGFWGIDDMPTELIAYRYGDPEDSPSVRIRADEYESIEVIKKEDE